jgi:hypothetical protein
MDRFQIFPAKILIKWSSLLVFAAVACQGSAGHHEEVSSLNKSEIFTCEAIDLVTSNVQIKSAKSQKQACALALDECWYKGEGGAAGVRAGKECVILKRYDDQTYAEGMTSGNGWACLVSEVLGAGMRERSWIRSGTTLEAARENAMRYCERNKAGNHCQIMRCFDADFVKPGYSG